MDNRKIAIYSRKSKFTGKGESIENQVEFCKARVRSQFPDVQASDLLIFEDEGFSGGNLNRPQFKEMMKLVKSNQIKAVYSYRLDRISRSVVDFANLYEVLNEHNVAYVSATECYETSTPLGRAMMSIATPIYYYEMSGQMKTLLDRCNPLYTTDYRFRHVYMLSVAAEDEEAVPEKALNGLQGWVDCFEEATLEGSLFRGGLNDIGEAGQNPVDLEAAYQFGKTLL